MFAKHISLGLGVRVEACTLMLEVMDDLRYDRIMSMCGMLAEQHFHNEPQLWYTQ